MRNIEICLSPDLTHLYTKENTTVVVIDIFRATSCMTAGLGSGLKSIRPVAEAEECRLLGAEGYVRAGERNGIKIPDFEMGNSPFEYMEPHLHGRSVAVTTTNGTLAIEKARGAREIIIGSFLNLSAVVNHLRKSENEVLLLCAGWKGRVNLEDTLFAGAVAARLFGKNFGSEDDATLAARLMYAYARTDLFEFLQESSHFKRLNRMDGDRDARFCLTEDYFNCVPILRGNEIFTLENF